MAVNVNVGDNVQDSTHHLSLKKADGTGEELGLIIPEGVGNIQQNPYSPSSLQFSTGRQGYGSFEPPYSSIDQKDWIGGRGQLNYEDASQFYDSYNAWTLTDKVLMPAPLWRFAKGLRSENVFMPGDTLTAGGTRNSTVSWQAMNGSDNSRYLAHKLTGTAYDVENMWLFMRYYGAPGTLNVAIYADSSNPTTAVSNSTVSLTAANTSKAAPEGDLVGQLICFQPATSPTLSATDFWVVVWCAASDNSTNYWEIAYGNQGGTAARSSDGSSWTGTGARTIFYRIEEKVPEGKIHWIEYKRGLYACTEPADGSPGKIFLNGDRGIMDSGGSVVHLESFEALNISGSTAVPTFLTPPNRFKVVNDGINNDKTGFCWKLTWDRTIGANPWNIYVTIKHELGTIGDTGVGMADTANFTGSPTPQYTDGTSPSGFTPLATEVRNDGLGIGIGVKTGYFGVYIETSSFAYEGTYRITKIQARDDTTQVFYTLWEETTGSVTMVDTTKSWTVNEWAGAYCHIWNGTGQGQWRKISSNTSDTLTVTPPWDIDPVGGGTDIGSEYVITGTDKWQDVTPISVAVITAPITDVLTLWGILYVAQGEKEYLARLREYNNSGTWTDFWGTNAAAATAIADGTNYALFLGKTYDPVHENFVWRARNENPAEWTGTDQTSISKADDVNWGTNLTFGNPIPIGSRDYLITNIISHNNLLWVGKENSVWWLQSDGTFDRAYQMQVGLEAITSPTNCVAMASKDMWLWFNWAHSTQRFYGTTLDDVGPWRGTGIIKRAKGIISFLEPAIGWMFYGVDANHDGQSSIMVLSRGDHTLFRGPSIVSSAFGGVNTNPRIRSGHWQSVAGQDATAWFWYEFGGDIMFMQMPISSLNPANDDDVYFAPESYVVQSQMDMGYAELEKLYAKSKIVNQNTSGTIYMDYDVNPDVHALSFTNAGSSTSSNDPSHEFTIAAADASRKRNIMNRVRISTSDISNTTKNNIDAIILDGFARTPNKTQWTFPVRLERGAKTLDGNIDHDPETLFNQLFNWSDGQAQALTVKSVVPWMDNDPGTSTNYTVVIEPMPMAYNVWDEKNSFVDGHVVITLRQL